MTEHDCTEFVRSRITQLRLEKNVSEHKMSLDIGKSGSYIRGITNGSSLPSLREFFNIIDYLGVTVEEFFYPMEKSDTSYSRLCEKLRTLDDAELEKVSTFVDWMSK